MKAPKKILIIEDESMLREALVENLTQEGYSVRGSGSAEEAFTMMQEDKPDIILTDLVMAGCDGFEVLRIIQESVHLQDIPVLVISNLQEKKDVDRAKALGARDFLVKAELSLDEITKRVKKIFLNKKVDK